MVCWGLAVERAAEMMAEREEAAGVVAKAMAVAVVEVVATAASVAEAGLVAQMVAGSRPHSSRCTPRRPGCPGRDSHRQSLSQW